MDKSKASNEYATQLFNFPPSSITDLCKFSFVFRITICINNDYVSGAVIGTLDSVVTECMEVLQESLMCSSVFEDVPKETQNKGFELLRTRFQQKMEPISSKLEVSLHFMPNVLFMREPEFILIFIYSCSIINLHTTY